jgi:hypothetical protein
MVGPVRHEPTNIVGTIHLYLYQSDDPVTWRPFATPENETH